MAQWLQNRRGTVAEGEGLSDFFTRDHKECDLGWTAVEAAVDAGDFGQAASAWQFFSERLQHHLRLEEEVIFVAFEEATGMYSGPTAVMRAEHTQMIGLVGQMQEARDDDDYQELVDLGDTLMMMMAQHNHKEEGILYMMADQTLGPQWPAIKEALNQLGGES